MNFYVSTPANLLCGGKKTKTKTHTHKLNAHKKRKKDFLFLKIWSAL